MSITNWDQPIQDPDLFFGRVNETRQILRQLKNKQSVSVVGSQKIGKSSLLNYVSHQKVISNHNLAPEDFVFVFIECHEMDQFPKNMCFAHLGQHINKFVKESTGILIATTENVFDLQRLCRKLNQKNIKLIVILDHFDALTRNTKLDKSFFDSLRALAGPMSQATFFIASNRPLFELEKRTPSISGSPFFNIFTEFPLNRFDLNESRSLLHHLLLNKGLALQPNVLDKIVDYAQGHPYVLQMIGSDVLELWRMNAFQWRQSFIDMLEKKIISFWSEDNTLARSPNDHWG